MNIRKLLVNVFEYSAFILPIMPDSFNARITIASIYFIGHYYIIQNQYIKIKNNFINYHDM